LFAGVDFELAPGKPEVGMTTGEGWFRGLTGPWHGRAVCVGFELAPGKPEVACPTCMHSWPSVASQCPMP
jgi:hypothetical protein